MDVLALEKTHEYKGVYHVLHGIISPLKKIDTDQIRIKELFARDLNQFTEIIFALPGTTEAEATALYLIDRLEQHFSGLEPKPNITRLARGIPSGSDLDYLDIGTLSRAMVDRREF
jgi:recombination protein RecR